MQIKIISLFYYAALFFLLHAGKFYCQDFSVKSYTVMDGMPSSTIHSVAQDGKGRMWFASRNGISVYDGNTWKNYSKADGLGNSVFVAVSCDQSGNIWGMAKSTTVELVCFGEDSFRMIESPAFEDINSDFISNKCFAVYADSKDTVAVVASGQKGIYVYKNGKWKNFNTSNGLLSNEIRDIKECEGSFYILTARGILVLNKDLTFRPFEYQLPLDIKNKLRSVFIETEAGQPNKKFYFLGDRFIGSIRKGEYSTIVTGFDIGEVTKLDYPRFYPDFHGYYFFGTSRNLFVYNENKKTTTFLSNQKNSIFTGINSVIKDREDNLWIISFRGAYKIRIPKFTNLNSQNGLLKDEVTAIYQMGNTMLFGHEEGITFYNGGKPVIKRINDKLRLQSLYRVMQFTRDSNGNVWFAAANKGLGRIDKNYNIKWFKLPYEESYNVISVTTDRMGKIYAATNTQIYKYEDGKFVRLDIDWIKSKSLIRRITVTDKNELMICTMGVGLLVGNEKNGFKNYMSSCFPAANSIYSVFLDGKETLVGTLNGIFCISGDSLKRYEKIRVDRPVFFIGKEKNNFWVGTDFGVIKWHEGVQINFTPQENLAGLETNRSGFYVDKNENVWIGTDKGVSKYIKPKTAEKIYKPVLMVKFLNEKQNQISSNKKIELKHSENELLVGINVISYINESQNVYTAKLDNFDKDWLPEMRDNEKLRYTNLPPGTYHLRIKGKNALGTWSDEYVSSEIIILSPFYLQWWFIILAAGMLVLIAYLIVGYLGKQRYTSQLEREVQNRTALLKESENKYKNLVSNIHDGVYVVQDNIVRYTNKSMADMLGYAVEDLIGKEWSCFAFEDDIEMLANRVKKRLQGDQISSYVELRMKHKEGKIITVVSNSNLIEFENKPAVFGTLKDITEQKIREAELTKLFTAVQQSPSSVIITDPDGIVEYVNPVFEKITGYNSGEIIGRKTNVIKSELMPPEIYKELWDTISTGKIWRGELLNLRKDEKPYWVSASIAPVKNIEGEITNYIAVEEDITFDKYARQEIERKEKLLSATLDNVPVIIFVINSSGFISFIKGNGLDLLGYFNEKELLGRPIGDIFGENKELSDDIKRVMRKESFTVIRFVDCFVFEIHYTAITEGFKDDSAAIGLAVNVTDYYNAEKTIKESESKIKALLAALPDYMFEVNKERMIVTYQRPADAIITSRLEGEKLNIAFPSIYPAVEKSIEEVFATGESQQQIFDFVYKGERRYFEARFVLKDEDRIVAIVRDVTEKIKAEKELIKAKEVAEKSDRLKSEFLAHMSHEIRTPVNTILNFTSLIEEELIDKLSNELKDGFEVIRDGGMRLIRTIDLILNMSQIQTGTYNPNYHYIDIDKKILPSLIQEFHYRAKSKNIELVYKMNSTNSTIYADDYTIGQIFANLIDNALKYTKEGKIEVVLSNNDGKLIVEVIDTGIGISNEYLPNLFAPFTQEEMGYTRRFDGTGLGLALVKKYVEINNAEIFVESEKEKGAKFIVAFPLARNNKNVN